jgi:hypothetical protein
MRNFIFKMERHIGAIVTRSVSQAATFRSPALEEAPRILDVRNSETRGARRRVTGQNESQAKRFAPGAGECYSKWPIFLHLREAKVLGI